MPLQPLHNAMNAQTITAPGELETVETIDDDAIGDGFRAILYNDNWHGMDEVVLQIQKATGCDLPQAAAVMIEAHCRGRAVCFKGSRERCHKVCRVLREIRLQCEVDADE
jgi:ATP-dependent Clp protease adapter protein ClpS